ncbi:MAG: sigma-70 family RNA polymerase sigma factor [Dehalococcoidia bacterium]|jgi:RNA polymerase sigma-70 factor, ECF subfamily
MKTVTSTPESRETELVEKLRSGDRTGTEDLYNTYKKKLYYLVLEQVDRNQAVAEDLVHEVFLAALDSLDKFRGDSRLYTWLRSIAFHKINDYYRRRAREPRPEESPTGIDTTKLQQAAANEPAVLTAMESAETRQEVHQALVDLPQDYQEVLVLKYFEEMPVLEISQVMGRSPKSVEGLLARARKALRTNLAENNHAT